MIKKKTEKNKKSPPYLSEQLIQPYLKEIDELYLKKKKKDYESQHPALLAIHDYLLYDDLLTVYERALKIIYMGHLKISDSRQNLTIEKQIQLIRVLQTLETQSSFEAIEKQLDELTGNTHPGYFWTLFNFIHAKTIYSNEKRLPGNVENFLKRYSHNPSEETIQEYLAYLHEMTTTCVRDFIEHALDNFERLFPSVVLTGIKDTRVKTQRLPAELTNSSARFQFEEEPDEQSTASATYPNSEPLPKPILGRSVRFQFQQEEQENNKLDGKKNHEAGPSNASAAYTLVNDITIFPNPC